MQHRPLIVYPGDGLFSRDLVGGKGYGLLRLREYGLPVPGFTILTTETYAQYKPSMSDPVKHVIYDHCRALESAGGVYSVRSGAPVSMPGMMDTVLNVGCTLDPDAPFERVSAFLRQWATVVRCVPSRFVKSFEARANLTGIREGTPEWNDEFRAALARVGAHVPDSLAEQLVHCIDAVFRSFGSSRARAYRKAQGISEDIGTACVIQRMVYGDADANSGSGVMFSRCPSTGDPRPRGEIAWRAQGEAVVSGSVTPDGLDNLRCSGSGSRRRLYARLCDVAHDLEQMFGDVQDIEFTVERGVLYLLQTRDAKMSARARVVTALALGSEFGESPLEAVKARLTRAQAAVLCAPRVSGGEADFRGLGASPGAVCGKVVTRATPVSAIRSTDVLVADDTSPEDFPQMEKAGAILTRVGGYTCHAAVVARGIGKPAVVGCGSLPSLRAGQWVTVDGATGGVYLGKRGVEPGTPPSELFAALPDDGRYLSGLSADALVDGLVLRIAVPLDARSPRALESALRAVAAACAEGADARLDVSCLGLPHHRHVGDVLHYLSEEYGPDLSGTPVLVDPDVCDESAARDNAARLGATDIVVARVVNFADCIFGDETC